MFFQKQTYLNAFNTKKYKKNNETCLYDDNPLLKYSGDAQLASLEDISGNAEDNYTADIEQENINFKENVVELEKDIQRLYYIIVIEKIKKLQFPVYISYYYDFRGRMYPRSAMGFTYLKIIRPFFKTDMGEKLLDEECVKNSMYYKKIINSNISLNKIFGENTHTCINHYFLVILFLELGKLKKKDIIQKNGVTLQEFVDKGGDLFLNKNFDGLDVEEYAYALSIINCIEHYISSKHWLNITIIRDSTASSLQHWGIMLGIHDEYLNVLNLHGDRWYDIYTVIIDMFINSHKEYLLDKNINCILNRNILKTIIMVVNYNAGKRECLRYLIEKLKTSKLYVSDFKYEQFCNDFHNFISKNLFNTIYVNSKDLFLQAHTNSIKLGDANINLAYLKTIDTKEVIKIKDMRWIFSIKKLENEICLHKTLIAQNANIIQASDAELARYLVNNLDIFAVHDSFAINLYELHKLMDLTNKFFNLKLINNQYSLFIII